MKITKELLKQHDACTEGYEYVVRNNYIGIEYDQFISRLMTEAKRFDWANWLIIRLMSRQQKIQYAVFAAELVLHIYEDTYPRDNRPRKAIEAAKAYLEEPSAQSKAIAAAAAAYDDAAAACAAYAAAAINAIDAAAAYDAAAAAAAYDAAAAAYAAYAAAAYDDAAYDAAAAAAAAAYAYGNAEIKTKIIDFGLELLRWTK